MARKPEEKPKRSFRSLLFRLALFAVGAYLIVGFVAGQMQLAAKQRERAELEAQVELQAEQNRELLRMMETDDDAAYVERMARERLGYAKPHERVYVDLTGE